MNDIYNSNSSSAIKDLNNLRNKLNSSIKDLSTSTILENNSNKQAIKDEDIKIGATFLVNSFNQEGIILSNPKNNKVQVQIGSTKIFVETNNLSYLSKQKIKNSGSGNKVNTSSISNIKSKNATTKINVIGLNVDEATFIIDKFLDDAYLSKLQKVEIVHGKGTGALRQGIHTFLKTHPHVKSFRLGTFGEGETGVTIVEIK